MFRKKNPIKELQDEKLIAVLKYNDTAAFNELYKRYSNRILYYFFRMLGNDRDLAQDFLQELFCKIIEKSSTFQTDKKFSTWIFSIAHNMCKNEYRKREVRKVVMHTENLDDYCANDVKEEKHPVTVEDVFNELKHLDESHRTAFILKYREGFCINEICEIMQLPKGTVKSRLFYARKRLQERLENKMSCKLD